MATAAALRKPKHLDQPAHDFSLDRAPKRKPGWAGILLVATAADCIFQLAWFWRYTAHNINFDAISYIGVARHLADGDFRASLQGYWSPLLSWCIFTGSVFSHNFLVVARVVTILSFVLCLASLYAFTLKLWGSRTLAAASIFCFSMARGAPALAVSFIGADFLFTAVVLAYFTRLIKCLRNDRTLNWLILGAAHAAAFLAKAFAMPWLTISSVVAALISYRTHPRRALLRTGVALALPVMVWITWATILQSKYGHFSAGYQAKANLLDPVVRNLESKNGLAALVNTSATYDRYMVVDGLYPGDPLWNARLEPHNLIRRVFQRERLNLPEAMKQIAVLATPGGLLAFAFVFYLPRAQTHSIQRKMAWIVLSSACTLVAGYCMLVFDWRYVLPAVALILAVAAPCLLPLDEPLGSPWRFIPPALFVLGAVFFMVYRASPFRTLHRDYQTGVYSAAAALGTVPSCNRLVVVGEGPFPEYGVGWEAGIYASFFANCRMVGFNETIPAGAAIEPVLSDVRKLNADSVLLLGMSSRSNYIEFQNALKQQGNYSAVPVSDSSSSGHIGELFWR